MTDGPQPIQADSLVPAEQVTGGESAPAVRADAASFQTAFLRLVERRTAMYTMGESSSVPRHVAVELVRSVCFVLGIDPESGVVPERLLAVDLEKEFARGLADIERKVELSQQLWQEACIETPPIHNIALRDTLETIGEFPREYDYRSFAHDASLSFDYQLCQPVPGSFEGVDYINEYLRRLLTESRFLGAFDMAAVTRVLASSCPDYRGLLINLYEPVAANALGLALLGKDPRGLDVSARDREEIARRLGAMASRERAAALRDAATFACDALCVEGADARDYLAEYARELQPRIGVGLRHGDLSAVFTSAR